MTRRQALGILGQFAAGAVVIGAVNVAMFWDPLGFNGAVVIVSFAIVLMGFLAGIVIIESNKQVGEEIREELARVARARQERDEQANTLDRVAGLGSVGRNVIPRRDIR